MVRFLRTANSFPRFARERLGWLRRGLVSLPREAIVRLLIGFGLVLIASVCYRPARADAPAALHDVGIDQRLNEQVPLDLKFFDETGKAVRLGDYFGRKPVILVLAYYRCPMLCTLVLNGLAQAIHDMPLEPGKDYEVVTVSFDPRETPDLAAAKKTNYIAHCGRAGAADAWHFLTGNAEPIRQLAAAVGFRYVYDAEKDQYIHASGVMVVTPSGKLSRYFFGIQYPTQDLRLGLIEASGGRVGSPVDAVLLFCFHYDPALGKYTANVLNFVRAGGVLTIFALVGMVCFLVKRQAKSRPRLRDLIGEPP